MNTLIPNTPEWLAARKSGIGSSDAAAILGFDDYRTPLHVYLDKRGLAPPEEQNDAMEMGHLLEPVIAELYQRRTGERVDRAVPMVYHPKYPFMFANCDYNVTGKRKHVECKSANLRMAKNWGEPGSDSVPEGYLIQVQDQMACTGYESTDVAVLIAGSDFRIYTIQRSETIIAEIERANKEFWDRVERSDPPEPDWKHPATGDLLKLIHKTVNSETVELPEWTAQAWQRIKELDFELATRKDEREALMNKIRFAMQDCCLGLFPGGTRQLNRTLVQDSLWSPEDIVAAQKNQGKVKRKGHVRFYEQEAQ